MDIDVRMNENRHKLVWDIIVFAKTRFVTVWKFRCLVAPRLHRDARLDTVSQG
jgi:hypothetical protein